MDKGREPRKYVDIFRMSYLAYKYQLVSAHITPKVGSSPRAAMKYAKTLSHEDWDITYLWTDEGWLYLAIVLDLFNREVVGWSLKPRMTADIVTDALDHGLVQEAPGAGAAASLRPRQPVRQPRLSGQAQGIRHDLLDEPERELLG